MSKLDELRNLVAEWFNSAEAADKSTIDKLSQVTKLTEDAVAEQNKLQQENQELLHDYKELVVHTSLSDKHNEPSPQVDAGAISLEEALQEFIKNQK